MEIRLGKRGEGASNHRTEKGGNRISNEMKKGGGVRVGMGRVRTRLSSRPLVGSGGKSSKGAES